MIGKSDFMSRIAAEFSDNKLIIKKEMLRKRDDNTDIIDIHDLVLNKEYKSKIKASSKRQNNKMILMHEITGEDELEIAVKNAENEGKSEEYISDLKKEYADLINNDDLEKKAVAVYIKDYKVCYCYGTLSRIYKRLIEFIYKIASIKLNRNGISIFMYLYIINRFKFDITNKRLEVGQCITEDVEIHEVPGKISKKKILFSKYKTRINVKKSELEKTEVPINNNLIMKMDVNGETISYYLGKEDRKIKKPREYYHPIKSMYNDEYAFHIRRDNHSNLVLVKRLKEPIEDTFKFKLYENKFSSFLMYEMSKIYKKIRPKKINLFYEKFAGKVEEGAFDLCKKCVTSSNSKNYFIITEDSPDYERIKDNDFIVTKFSLKYYWLIYNANSFISSDAPLHVNILRSNNKYLRRSLLEKKFVFLQHGVTYLKAHDTNSAYRNEKEAEPDYMIANGEKEREVICEMLNIPEERIWNTGLPIFDAVEYKHINNDSDDVITIMLTWKPYEEHLYDFKESSYYQSVMEIYDMLSKYIDRDKIYIIPHPKVFDLLMNTGMKDNIWQGPISEVLKISKLLITDYSSVAYNTFYQGGGVVFYQPDLRLYEKMNGKLVPNDDEYIGKRAFNIDQLEDITKETIKDGKIDLDKIRTRQFEENHASINEFSDGKNIERIYNKLIKRKLI